MALVLKDPLDRRILALAVPALGTLAVEPLYVATDTAIVGHLGTGSLAGLAIASQVLVLLAGLCNFLAYGTTPRIAQFRGRGRFDLAGRTAVQSLWLALLVGVPLGLLVAVGARPIGEVLGATGDGLESAVSYLQISALSIPALLATIACHGILRAELRLRGLLVVVLLANLANVVIELIMVYPLGLGIAGSAWSTVIVQFGSVGGYFLLIKPTIAQAPDRRPVLHELRRLLDVGGLLMLRVVALMATFTLATAVAARIDQTTLAAHQIVASMFMLVALSLDALAIPAQTLVAETIDVDRDLARTIGRHVLRLSLWCGGVLAFVLVAASAWIPQLFSDDQGVINRASGGLVMLAVLLIPGSVAFAVDGILIGAGQYRALSVMMVQVLIVFLPAIAMPVVVQRLGVLGIWGALALWMAARAVVGWQRADEYLWAD